VVLGAIPLVRPNALLFVPAALAWLAIRRRGPRVWRDTALGIVCLAAVLSLMGLRNYMAGGGWVMFTPTAWYMLDVPGYGYQVPGAEPCWDRWSAARAFAVVRLAAHAVWHDPARVCPVRGGRFVAGFAASPGLGIARTDAHVGGLGLKHAAPPGPHGGAALRLAGYLPWPAGGDVVDRNYGFRYVVPGVLPRWQARSCSRPDRGLQDCRG
jgi:hypothetical protein